MSTTDIDARAEAAGRIARTAGAMALAFFRDREALVVEAKGDPRDVVSRADREVEAFVRAEISRSFPDDGVLGEEAGLAPGGSGVVWVVDPIDGTAPFLRGMSFWCVAIAVTVDGETVAGAIFDPSLDELFEARRGAGASLNGAPLRLDPALTLRDGMTGVGASHRTDLRYLNGLIGGLLGAGGMFFRHGSGALMLAYVAAGRLVAYAEPHMNAWDCLAGLLLVEEAGGWTWPYPGPGGIEAGGEVLCAAAGAADELRSLYAAALSG